MESLDELPLRATRTTDAKPGQSSNSQNEKRDTVVYISTAGQGTTGEDTCTSRLSSFYQKHRDTIAVFRNAVFLSAYFVYFACAVKYRVGDEGSWRLIGFTVLGSLLLLWTLAQRTKALKERTDAVKNAVKAFYTYRNRARILRWCLYTLMTLFMVVYLLVAVIIRTPKNLRSLMGIFSFLLILFLYSNNRTKVNWHTVYWGMALQFLMALMILKTSWGAGSVRWFGDRLLEFVANANAGSKFMFGVKYTDHPFIFQAAPGAMLLLVGISVITYLGVIQYIVGTVGRALAFALQTDPAEGIFIIGAIFLYVPQNAILILDYLPRFKPSQLFVVTAGALATVGGTSIVIFNSFGIPASPLIAASAMSGPAALAAAKLAFPTTPDEQVPDVPKLAKNPDQSRDRVPRSLMEAVVEGIGQAVSVVMRVVVFVLVFLSIVQFINSTLTWFGDRVGVRKVTLEFIFSYAFYPFAFLMGARHEDCLKIGELLGLRTFSLAVMSYKSLAPLVKNGATYRQYISNPNNTWSQHGADIFLEATNITLVGGVIEERSEVIAAYALCGSASVAVVGIILGSFEVLVPHRRAEVVGHMMRSMVVGTVASYLTACFAGLLFEEDIGYS